MGEGEETSCQASDAPIKNILLFCAQLQDDVDYLCLFLGWILGENAEKLDAAQPHLLLHE